jgi:hypothetical protein
MQVVREAMLSKYFKKIFRKNEKKHQTKDFIASSDSRKKQRVKTTFRILA